jgi:phage terminase large subunit GpA-like protein
MIEKAETTETRSFPPPLRLEDEEIEARDPGSRRSFLDWLESEYYLSPKVHGLSLKWSRSYGPFWVDIIEAIDDPVTREVWVYAPAQSGKSTIMTGWLGHAVDCDPVPMSLVMPRDDDASERVECNIIPMFEMNPRLLDHIGGRANNINIGKLTMFDNMAFYLMFATSAATLSGKAICKIGMDEIGKWPARVGKESDPVSLCRDRLETFKSRSTILGITTPVHKDDLADVNWKKGDRCEFWFKCPHCRDLFLAAWDHVELDKDDEGSLLSESDYADGGHARYVCPLCQRRYTEADRWLAVLSGEWRTAEGEIPRRGRIRSFRIRAWMLHPAIQTCDYLASRWAAAMEAKDRGDLLPLQNFVNSRKAEVWERIEAKPDEAQLRIHVTDNRRSLVPVRARILTIAVDVQLDHVWLATVTWGYQFEGWLIEARRIETGSTQHVENFQAVVPYLEHGWEMAEDKDLRMFPSAIGVDCGYRTDQVLAFCRSLPHLPVFPVMGFPEDRIRGRLYRAVRYSETQTRYDLNVDRLKNSIYRQLFVARIPGPGFIHLFNGIDEELLRHLLAEHQVPKGDGDRQVLTWVLRSSHWPNHLWDLLVYNRFLAEQAGVPALMPETPAAPRRKTEGRPSGNTRGPMTRNR